MGDVVDLVSNALRKKLAWVPTPTDEPVVALWGRAGVSPEAKRTGAVGFGLEQMLAG